MITFPPTCRRACILTLPDPREPSTSKTHAAERCSAATSYPGNAADASFQAAHMSVSPPLTLLSLVAPSSKNISPSKVFTGPLIASAYRECQASFTP